MVLRCYSRIPVKYWPTFLPGSRFKRQALETRKLVRKMITEPFQMVKDAIVRQNSIHIVWCLKWYIMQVTGTAVPSFTAELLTKTDVSHKRIMEDDNDIMGAAGGLFAGEGWIPNAILGILTSVCSSGNGHS